MKRGYAVLGLIALLALPVLALRWWFDPADLKLRAADAVRRATGWELTIAGPLTLSWTPMPHLRAGDVHLANPPSLSSSGSARPDMATAQSVEAGIALLPLLTGRVRLTDVRVVEPDIQLERAADGQPNWRIARAAPLAETTGTSAPLRPRRPIEFDGVRISQGRLAWRLPGRTIEMIVPDLLLSGVGAAAALDGTVAVAGLPFVVHGPVTSLHVSGAGADLTVGGALDAPTLSGTLKDLSVLSPLAGVPLPPVRDLIFAGHADQLEAHGQWGGAPVVLAAEWPGRATLSLAGASLSLDFSGDTIDLKADIPDLAAIGTVAGLALPPLTHVRANARLQPGPGGDTALRGLRIMADQGDLSGDAVLGWNGRPSLRGSLVSQRLDGSALMPRPLPAAAAAPASPVPQATPKAGRVFSDRTLPFAALARADADLQVSVGSLRIGQLNLLGVQGHVRLLAGHLRIDPLQAQTDGGTVGGRFEADADPARAALMLNASGLNLNAVGSSEGGALAGMADVDLVMAGQGSTAHALASTATGHAGLALVRGEIDNAGLAGLLTGLLGDAMRGLPVDGRGRSAVRCLGLSLQVTSGKAVLQALTLDATRLRVTGEGGADLANETSDLLLNVAVAVGGTSIAAPVHLDGPWRTPHVRMEPKQGRVGFTIRAPDATDTCPSALLAARDGRPGPAPEAAAAPKPAKPADLLRSLLR